MEPTTNLSIAKRFTEEMYAKKEDVRRELNTSLVDPFWESIKNYRSSFSKYFNLNTVSLSKYFVCNIYNIVENTNNTLSKLGKCLTTYVNLDNDVKEAVKAHSHKNIIKTIGKFYKEEVSDEFVSTIINGKVSSLQGLSEGKLKTNNYFEIYKSITNEKHIIDLDYLLSLYVKFSHKDNLVTLYRNFDFRSNTYSVINTEHNGAPYSRIERLMNGFYQFLLDNSISSLVKASTAYYYINYIKPFDSYNEEIALLTYETILANDDKEEICYLLNFEKFLNRKNEFTPEFKEADRNGDITYTLIKCIDFTNEIVNEFLDDCTLTKNAFLNQEHVDGLKENNEPTPTSAKIAQVQEAPVIKRVVGNIAIPNIESGLDEKDASKYEKYLLMKNPLLKKSQAHFFARHCTIGCYYTIQMFKKSERVVYETARTSMESLTELGYYQKKQIKNKFVYTPIKLEDK